jgi:hypothetical protein
VKREARGAREAVGVTGIGNAAAGSDPIASPIAYQLVNAAEQALLKMR